MAPMQACVAGVAAPARDELLSGRRKSRQDTQQRCAYRGFGGLSTNVTRKGYLSSDHFYELCTFRCALHPSPMGRPHVALLILR
jgi:hypothetical protein